MKQTPRKHLHCKHLPDAIRTGGMKKTVAIFLVSVLLALSSVGVLAAATEEQLQTPATTAAEEEPLQTLETTAATEETTPAPDGAADISADNETTEAVIPEQTEPFESGPIDEELLDEESLEEESLEEESLDEVTFGDAIIDGEAITCDLFDDTAFDNEEIESETAAGETSGKRLAPRSATSLSSSAKTAIKNGIMNCQTIIDLSSYGLSNTDAVQQLVNNYAKNGSPLFFNVDLVYPSKGSTLTAIKIDYYYSASQFNTMLNKISTVASSLLNGVRGNSSLGDVEKALLIHDRLALRCEYNKTASNAKSLYGALVGRKAQCKGYSMAYWYLLNQAGIPCTIVSSAKLDHMWNIVSINGKYYHVDVTFDDTSTTKDVTGLVMHDNFLRSTNGIKNADHKASDFTTTPSDTTYDGYFWQKSKTAFVLLGNKIYYIDGSGNIKRYSNKTTLCTTSAKWPRLCTDGTYLYYNTNSSLICYTVSTGATKTVKTFSGSGKYVVGLAYEDGYLIGEYTASTNYSSSTKTNDGFRIKYPSPKQYTVSFNANGGSGAPSSITVNAGNSITIPKAPSTAKSYTVTFNANGGTVSQSTKKYACSFSAWKYNGSSYAPGAKYTPAGNVTFTAAWSNPKLSSLPKPTRYNYTFDYWMKSDGTKMTSSNTISGNITLYAHWTPTATYTVSFNANGGSGAPGAIKVTAGSSCSIPAKIPSQFPKNFVGWATSSSATSASYLPGRSFAPSKTMTLYAVWKSPSSITASTTVNPNVNFGGKKIYYKIVPTVSGTMTVTGSGSCDTYGYLYNSSGTQLKYDDDSAGNGNFKYSYSVKAGTTYYAAVRLYSDTATGSFSVKFTLPKIVQEALDASRVTRTPTIIYTGQALPKVTVKNAAGKTLKEGTDYKVTYEEKTKPGEYKLTVVGINGYKGTVRKVYTIKDREALDASRVTRTPTIIYTGQALPKVTVKNAAGKTLKEGTDYKVTYEEKTKPGEYKLTVVGINGYKGTIRKTYTIKEREALDAANVTRTPTTFTYNGKQQQPKVTVKNSAGKVLKEGVDYKVTYPTSVSSGDYVVRVDGINGYSGTIRKTYTIGAHRSVILDDSY